MKWEKGFSLFLILLNLAGAACLCWFAWPYLTHDPTIAHPGAMLPAQRWDAAGMALTMGLLPLLAVNGLGARWIRTKKPVRRWLFFLPGAVCGALVLSYWVTAL